MRAASPATVIPAPWRVLAAALAALVFLAGCEGAEFGLAGGTPPQAAAATPSPSPPPAPAPAAPAPAVPDAMLAFVESAVAGQSSVLLDPVTGRVRVVFEREYPSAAGIRCRRFTVTPETGAGLVETRIACREPGGWRMVDLGVKESAPAAK
jgi:hypothetical protein